MLASSHLKFYTNACLHSKNLASLHRPLRVVTPFLVFKQISVFGVLEQQRTFSNTLTCYGGKDRKQKMIKNKALKKDPEAKAELKKLERTQRSHLTVTKYGKKSSGKKVEVWDNMSLDQLAEQTDIFVDDLFDLVLDLKFIDTDYIQSESQPLRNSKLLNMIRDICTRKIKDRTRTDIC